MSQQILFANNASSTLAGAIGPGATSINLSAGTGALFPNPAANQYFVGSFFDAATGLVTEIVHGTARGGDVVTIVRAQEGTVAGTWNAGDIFVCVPTAGTQAAFVQAANNPGNLLSTTVISAAGASTPTYPAGTNTVELILVGGGASGGGAAAPSGSQAAVGSGGGSGAYAHVSMAVATAEGQVLTIGAKGAAPSAGANNGNAGTASTFGALVSCPGGAAGSAGAAITPPALTGGSGNTALPTIGAGVTALLLSPGSSGDEGFAMTTTNVGSGYGGSSLLGPGASNSGGGAGAAAVAPGAGGSGGAQIASGAAVAGGAGQDGYAIIRCFS